MSGFAAKNLAPTAAALQAIPSNAASESVIPGNTGQQRIPTFMPAARSSLTAWKRKSGCGARGSSVRASSASGVVIVMYNELVSASNFDEQVDIALDQV